MRRYETYPVRSRETRLWLSRRYYQENGKPPGAQALQDALGVLEARALFDGPERAVHVRVAGHEDALFVDLANEAREVVRVSKDGWEVVSDAPVRFRRPKGMRPLPRPEEGGSVDDLRRFVNIKNEQDWRLVKGWLVQALNPAGPYPILIVEGEQGSAKTTAARILGAVVDPSATPVRTLPKNEEDLLIAAKNSLTLRFDNLSSLPPGMSDALCRLATGGGLATRELYTNSEEAIFEATRPVILTGIADIATRADLLDRAIVLRLPKIPEEERRPEKELREEFEAALPGILGALLGAVGVAMRELPNVVLPSLPRMADAALWATAAEGALGMEPGEYMEAYAGSRREVNELALEADPVATAVARLMEGRDEWIGTAAQLLKELDKRVDEGVRRFKTWPKQPQHLSRHLKRLAPVLRAEGIEVEDLPRQGTERRKRIFKNKPAFHRHGRHADPEADKNGDSKEDGSDDDVTVTADEGVGERHGEKPIEAPDSTDRDGDDGGDDEMRTHSKGDLVTTQEGLQDLIQKIKQAETVAFDTETYPQDDTNAALDPRQGRVRLLQVATEAAAGVVDVLRVDPTALLEVLREKVLVAHNSKFDLSFLNNQFGYEHNGPVVDTQVLDAVIYYAAGPRLEKDGWKGFPKDKPHRRSLADVAADYLEIELDKGAQSSDFGRDELSEEQVEYALKDVEILLPLKDAMMKRVEELGLERVVDLESRFTPALAYCEANGFALDIEGWREQALRAGEEAKRIKEECDVLAPPVPEGEGREGWNWASTKQLGTALELLGAAVPKHPTGNYKTDDATLKGITSPEEAAQLAQSILRYRGAKKKASTWGLEWFEPPKKKPRGKKFDKGHQIVVSGRVYSSFQQVVKTGRMSSSSPNLQNIPPDLRKLFVASPGRRLLIADYKQIELVTAAVVSGEEKLLEAFRRGDDVHSLTSRGILESDPARKGQPVTEEEVKAFRPKAKMVSFGILYGIRAKGLAWRIESNFGVHISIEEAQGLIDRFLDTYPALEQWYLEEHRKAERGDDITHTLTKRRRLLDVSKDYYGHWRANSSLRLNTPIQGSAGDGFKYAGVLLWERRHECFGNPKMVNMVHDEVVLEIDSEHVEAGKRWLEENMIEGMREVLGPDAPVYVEITAANNWGEKQ